MRRRRSFLARLMHGIRQPDRARRYVQRLRRDVVLRARHRGDHIGYYREVVADDLRHGQATAVGNSQRARWKQIGRLQFNYLKEHGLKPGHYVLEIGCGNLRAGWRIIRYLRPGHYYGVDISPDVILAAQDTIATQGLTGKVPYLTVVQDMRFALLPDDYFDVVHAHSVFSHCPLPVIEECFAHIARVMKQDAFFDFTFYRAHDKEYVRLREEFHYRVETLAAAARRHGFDAQLMEDWEGKHVQSKMRLTARVL
jgi:SAM-dependent methyltransferase